MYNEVFRLIDFVLFFIRTKQRNVVYTLIFEDIHNSWLYCFTYPLELGTRVSLSHRQPYVLVRRRMFPALNNY